MQSRNATQETAALVVDDDMTIRELIGEILESDGYAVELACDGQRALEQLRVATRRMVVVLDVMMPVLGGVELLEIVARDAELAARHGFLVMTASVVNEGDALLPLVRRFNAPVLTKPFSVESLLASARAVAGRLRD